MNKSKTKRLAGGETSVGESWGGGSQRNMAVEVSTDSQQPESSQERAQAVRPSAVGDPRQRICLLNSSLTAQPISVNISISNQLVASGPTQAASPSHIPIDSKRPLGRNYNKHPIAQRTARAPVTHKSVKSTAQPPQPQVPPGKNQTAPKNVNIPASQRGVPHSTPRQQPKQDVIDEPDYEAIPEGGLQFRRGVSKERAHESRKEAQQEQHQQLHRDVRKEVQGETQKESRKASRQEPPAEPRIELVHKRHEEPKPKTHVTPGRNAQQPAKTLQKHCPTLTKLQCLLLAPTTASTTKASNHVADNTVVPKEKRISNLLTNAASTANTASGSVNKPGSKAQSTSQAVLMLGRGHSKDAKRPAAITPKHRELGSVKLPETTFPMTAAQVLHNFAKKLTDDEKGELLDYQVVYYLGPEITGRWQMPTEEETNQGKYDDDKGDYKVGIGQHIGYRYEIVALLGNGSFGQAVKCLDHKTHEYVALKIIRSKKRFYHQATIEVKVLKYIRDTDAEGRANVVNMFDYFVFRKHIVRFHSQLLSASSLNSSVSTSTISSETTTSAASPSPSSGDLRCSYCSRCAF
jgi:hypothetical protein